MIRICCVCPPLNIANTRVDEYIILRPQSGAHPDDLSFSFRGRFLSFYANFSGIFVSKKHRSSHLNPQISNHQQRRYQYESLWTTKLVWNKTFRHLGPIKIRKNQKVRLTYFTCQQNHRNILPVIHEPPKTSQTKTLQVKPTIERIVAWNCWW